MTMNHMDLDEMVARIGYAQPARVKQDIMETWQRYAAMRHKAKTHFHSDGRESFLVALDGTVPISYQSATYHIPVEVLLSKAYPNEAPFCFVRPVSGMKVKHNHRHVTVDGRVHSLPYLSGWRAHSCNLSTLLGHLVHIFSQDPPVFADSSSFPSSSSSSSSSSPAAYFPIGSSNSFRSPPPTYDASIDGLSVAERAMLEVGQGNPRRRDEQLQQQQQQHHIHSQQQQQQQQQQEQSMNPKQSALAAVTTKTQRFLESFFDEISVELATEEDKFAKLTEGAARVETASQKMMELVAESQAIEDTLYALDRALVRQSNLAADSSSSSGGTGTNSSSSSSSSSTRNNNNLTLDVFMRTVRRLSQRQFKAQAHINKILEAQRDHRERQLRASVRGGDHATAAAGATANTANTANTAAAADAGSFDGHPVRRRSGAIVEAPTTTDGAGATIAIPAAAVTFEDA